MGGKFNITSDRNAIAFMNGKKKRGSVGFGFGWSLCGYVWHGEEPPDIAFTGNAIGRSNEQTHNNKKKSNIVEITLTERHAVCYGLVYLPFVERK